jgi:hypothetical protein
MYFENLLKDFDLNILYLRKKLKSVNKLILIISNQNLK